MMNFRISKYNPVFRDEYGCYTKEEWTSISDVDKEICGVKLSLGGYLNIENKKIICSAIGKTYN